MATLKDIYPYIKPYASGCPEPAIDAEATALAKQMAQRTYDLRDTILMDSQEGWGMYAIKIPNERQLEVVTKICVNGFSIEALGSKPCDGCSAMGYWIDRNQTVYIYPAPMASENDGIEIEYAFSPRLASCEMDADFLEKYGFDIAKGVLSRILMMKDQKWYSPQLAAKYDAEWKSAMIGALVDGATPYSRAFISLRDASDYLDT